MEAGERTDRRLITLALLTMFGGVLVSAAAPLAAAEQEEISVESRPVESNGVAVVISAASNLFAGNETLALRITFRNTTSRVIWLPRYYLALHLDDTATGKSFTGVSTLYGGVSLPQAPPICLQPHGSWTAAWTFERYGFAQGDASYAAAEGELFSRGKELRPDAPGLARFPLPAGAYHLAVELQIRSGYRQALPKNFASWKKPTMDDEYGILDLPEDFDSASLWKTDSLRSNPIEIKVQRSQE